MIPENDRPHALHLHLEAKGLPGLLPLLEAAAGAVLAGRFRLDGLRAVGRQSFVFAATDLESGEGLVVKQPAFDYRRPLPYSRDLVDRARRSLEREHAVLSACTTGHLPRPVALLTAPSPVPASEASPVLRVGERFLVEERIEGRTVSRLALKDWPALGPQAREMAARRIAREFVAFWEALRAVGWHYGDISANNLIVEESGRLRVVDCGSAVPAGDRVVLEGYTPAFTTPRLRAAHSRGRPVAGSLASVLPALAKLLHFALTRREPFNGAYPELDIPDLDVYSTGLRQVLSALLGLDARPDGLAQARDALDRWAGQDGP